MEEARRDAIIRAWFEMWLRAENNGIDRLFTPDCTYTESWGPQYRGIDAVAHWFREWNTRGKVVTWEIFRTTHTENRSYVEWFFEDRMHDGRTERFEGISVIEWQDDRIASLKEYGCRIPHYDPYAAEGKAKKPEERMWC